MFGKKVKRRESETEARKNNQVWTFSSSGWLFVYFFGVIKCLRQQNLHRNVYVVGSSGGACAGTYLFLDADIEKTIEYIKGCAKQARGSLLGPTRIREYVAGAIKNFQPEGAGKKLTGKLEISVTAVPRLRNVRIRKFESNEEVRDAILASACIVPPPIKLGVHGRCMDGAFSDFQILKALFVGGNFLTMHAEEDAISVCPFYMSRADIKPSKWIPPWWAAYPPPEEKLEDLFQLGFTDTLNWLKEHRHKLHHHAFESTQDRASKTNGDHQAVSDTESEEPVEDVERSLFSQVACQAPSCDETLKEAVVGAWGIARVLLGYILWFLICWELFFSSCISIGSLVVAFVTTPVVGVESFKQSYQRFKTLWRNANIVSWELLKTIPQSSLQKLPHNDRIGKQLKEHSVLYRTFYYVLQ